MGCKLISQTKFAEWMFAVDNHISMCAHAEHEHFSASQQTMHALNSK